MATTAKTSSTIVPGSGPPGAAPNPETTNSSSHISSRPPSYGSVVLTLENVLIPADKLVPSASARDGLDDETETFLRVGGCELIQTSGILLKLPQTAMATGQVLFQRFYYSKSFVRQPMETTAMACIYLASKIEEAPRRIRDVINVFHHIRQYRARKIIQPLILDPSYIRLKSDVTLAERRILKELGFCVHVKHPHKIIVMYMKTLDYDNDAKFVQLAWNYMNDALRTNVFVRFTPEAIACACIFLSARVLKIPLPNAPSWYLVFDVKEKDVIEIASNIIELYDRPAINYEQLEKKVDILAKAHQEMKLNKGVSSLLQATKANLTPHAHSPDSRPGSPQRQSSSTVTSSVPEIVITSASGKSHSSSGGKDKDSESLEKGKGSEKFNGDSSEKRKVQSHPESPPSKKSRRSPSPIIYNSSSYRDKGVESPSRHKHKKRKKSRYSSSRSRSRSRERRSSTKKGYRREPSPTGRKHHKKKSSHHHTRYSSSRSRSRSREQRVSSKKPHFRERDRSPSPTPFSPPRKHHVKKKSHNWPK